MKPENEKNPVHSTETTEHSDYSDHSAVDQRSSDHHDEDENPIVEKT